MSICFAESSISSDARYPCFVKDLGARLAQTRREQGLTQTGLDERSAIA